MKIQSVPNYNAQSLKNDKINNFRYNPSFQQISPEHMYINSTGFGRDFKWAECAVNIIDEAKNQMLKKLDLKNVLTNIAEKYKAFYDTRKPTGDLGPFLQSEADEFGVLREKSNDIWSTYITEFGKYGKYREPLIDLAYEKGGPREGTLTSINEYLTTYKTKKNEAVPLTNTVCSLPNPELDYSVYLQSPPVESTPKIIEEIDGIYKKIIDNKKTLTKKNIETITKDIARTHWLLSQLRPYKRGSAGVADMIAKSLFEAKGIQVSPYKKGINPNLEAFVMPLDKYVESYNQFFTAPLKAIETKK